MKCIFSLLIPLTVLGSPLAAIIDKCDAIDGSIKQYLKQKYTGEVTLDTLQNIVADMGSDVVSAMMYSYNSYTLDGSMVRNSRGIVEILFPIAKEVNDMFLRNRFVFPPKRRFEDILRYDNHIKNFNTIVKSALRDDIDSLQIVFSLINHLYIDIREQITLLKKLSRRTHGWAYGVLGEMYLNGYGVNKSNEKAILYFEKGAVLNDPSCLNGLGRIYMMGEYRDIKKSNGYLMKAVKEGSVASGFNLFVLYKDFFKNSPTATGYLMLSKKGGYIPALFEYAKIMYEHKMYDSAIPSLLAICDNQKRINDIFKSCEIAFVNRDFETALVLSIIGFEMGSQISSSNLMYILDNHGEMVSDVDNLRFKILLKMASSGINTRLVDLGDCYYYGIGTEKSYDDAFSFYLAAAMYNSGSGLYSLAYMYQYGLGCEKDEVLAIRYLLKIPYVDSEGLYVLIYVLPYFFIMAIMRSVPVMDILNSVALVAAVVLLRIAQMGWRGANLFE